MTSRQQHIVKVGFHYPSSRPEFTGRVDGPRTRVHFRHPSTRTGVRFPLSELTARVDGCQKMHPSSRAVNSARELGLWTRVVETDLKCGCAWSVESADRKPGRGRHAATDHRRCSSGLPYWLGPTVLRLLGKCWYTLFKNCICHYVF